MKIVVIGGKLQGVEAVYLARQAGWETVLVDRDSSAPATGICDRYCPLDVKNDSDKLKKIIKTADMVIPALENRSALSYLRKLAAQVEVPLAFDASSYEITSSKKESDKLFRENRIPAPAYWPDARLPVIVKPSTASGSKGVERINTYHELETFLDSKAKLGLDEWVVQEYLSGPSYSIEVIGLRGNVVSYQVTELEMDGDYDCKRVLAPALLTPLLQEQFREIAAKIAQLINLTGIMDVEVIEHQGVLKVLEIDARLPSQTPIAVWQSTGVNMLERLSDVYMRGRLPDRADNGLEIGVVYEHIRVSQDGIESLGEHVMAKAGPLRLLKGFWGSDEALTNYMPCRLSWVATLIFTGYDRAEAWAKRCETIKSLQKLLRLQYVDSSPLI